MLARLKTEKAEMKNETLEHVTIGFHSIMFPVRAIHLLASTMPSEKETYWNLLRRMSVPDSSTGEFLSLSCTCRYLCHVGKLV